MDVPRRYRATAAPDSARRDPRPFATSATPAPSRRAPPRPDERTRRHPRQRRGPRRGAAAPPGPADRPARARDGPAARRPLLRPDARRLRRRGHQDRAARQRRPDAPVGQREGPRQVPVVPDRRAKQALGDAEPAHSRGPGHREEARRGHRHPGRELPPRHDGALGARLRGTVRDQPATRHGARHRLRPDGPVRAARRLRRDRRGDGRASPRRRRPRLAAEPDGHLDRRRAGRGARVHGRADGDPLEGAHRARPGRGLGDLRVGAEHDGEPGDRVRRRRPRARAHRGDPAEDRAVERLPDRGRQAAAGRREPGQRVREIVRGDGPAGARERRALRDARRARRPAGRARRADRGLDLDRRARAAREAARRRRGPRRADLQGRGHARRPPLRPRARRSSRCPTPSSAR